MANSVRSKESKQTKKKGKSGLNDPRKEERTMSNSDTEGPRRRSICLEVANVRLLEKGVQIQVKGDRADNEPVWWAVSPSALSGADDSARYRTITEGLDKKRIVIAELGRGTDSMLECTSIRIQYAESNSR